MKKLVKLLPFILVFCLIFVSVPVYANADTYVAKNQELVLTNNSEEASVTFVKQQNPQEVSITFVKQEDGSFKQVSKDQINALSSTTEVVAFHLGLKDWVDDDCTIYWYATSNLPSLTSVSANTYIKSTSILFPTTYYNGGAYANSLGGVTYATDCTYLYGYVPSDVTVVRVGWTNLVLTTIENTYTGSNSSVVYKP